MTWHKGDTVRPGAVFKGANRNGKKTWTTTCTITEATPGQVFAFDVHSARVPVAHWRYDIIAADGGCRVTESTWDNRPGWFAKIAGFAAACTTGCRSTPSTSTPPLRRLKARAENPRAARDPVGDHRDRRVRARPRASSASASMPNTYRARRASAAVRVPRSSTGARPTASR